MKQAAPPEWPRAINVTREPIGHRFTNLSQLPKADRARIFGQLKTRQPEIADLVTRMHQRFGAVELFLDHETAKTMGAQS